MYLLLSRDFQVHPLHRHRRTRTYGRRRSSFWSLISVTVVRDHYVMTGTTWVSFPFVFALTFSASDDDYPSCLWTINQLLSTDGILPRSSPRRLFSLFDSWLLVLFPQLRSELWSFEFSDDGLFTSLLSLVPRWVARLDSFSVFLMSFLCKVEAATKTSYSLS